MDEVQEPHRRPRLDRKDESGPVLHFKSTTEMASTMARTDVAMKMWLSIVGAAKRDGHDAVSHRHGTYVDFIQHGLSEKNSSNWILR